MNTRPQWKDPLAACNKGLEDYFDALGKEFYSLYKALGEHPDIEFSLTPKQHEQFNEFFIQIQEKYLGLQGLEYIATIRRLGLIAFRMAMILTSLRIMETKDFSQKLECRDEDFQRVLSMIRVLIRHSSHVFSQLPEVNKTATHKNKKEQFLDGLMENFNRRDYLETAKLLQISEKTAQEYIKYFCDKGWILREQRDTYIKANTWEGPIENKSQLEEF